LESSDQAFFIYSSYSGVPSIEVSSTVTETLLTPLAEAASPQNSGQQPQGGTAGPPAVDPCPADKRRFFNWLADPLRKMAQDLNTTPTLVLTHAAKEAGWTNANLDHNQPLNNPFGVNKIKNGKAAGNIGYPSLDAAIDYYKTRFGSNVGGSRTADDYINALEHPPNGQPPFNKNIKNYTTDFKNVKTSMVKFMRICGIQE
jgi:hypothetical protein